MEPATQFREVEHHVYKQKKLREQNQEDENQDHFVSYTDPSRNIAVGDLSNELLGSLKKKKSLGTERVNKGSDSDVAHRQAIHFMKKNDFECAFKFIEKARICALKEMQGLQYQSYVSIIVTEAQCFLKLGDFNNAKQYADKVLSKHKSSEAQFVKAEALYNLCQFEHALVAFNKGARMVPDSPEFYVGKEKCQETINNIVKRPGIFMFKGCEAFFDNLRGALKVNKDAINDFIQEDPANSSKQRNLSKLTMNTRQKTKEPKQRKPHRLAADKAFLTDLATGLRGTKIQGSLGRSVNSHAREVLDYMETRDQFWKQIDSGE